MVLGLVTVVLGLVTVVFFVVIGFVLNFDVKPAFIFFTWLLLNPLTPGQLIWFITRLDNGTSLLLTFFIALVFPPRPGANILALSMLFFHFQR